MNKHKLFGLGRIACSLLALAAIATQLMQGLQRPTFDIFNFFSFFTIESNIFAAVLLALGGLLLCMGKTDERLALWRGAATLYMLTTGIIYVLLLSGLEESLQTPIPWVNAVLHYLMPAVLLLDWLVMPPRRTITLKQAAAWLTFPVLYFVYSSIRGFLTAWYPYPFLSPWAIGYTHVLATSAVILLAEFILAWLLALVPKLRPLDMLRKAAHQR